MGRGEPNAETPMDTLGLGLGETSSGVSGSDFSRSGVSVKMDASGGRVVGEMGMEMEEEGVLSRRMNDDEVSALERTCRARRAGVHMLDVKEGVTEDRVGI